MDAETDLLRMMLRDVASTFRGLDEERPFGSQLLFIIPSSVGSLPELECFPCWRDRPDKFAEPCARLAQLLDQIDSKRFVDIPQKLRPDRLFVYLVKRGGPRVSRTLNSSQILYEVRHLELALAELAEATEGEIALDWTFGSAASGNPACTTPAFLDHRGPLMSTERQVIEVLALAEELLSGKEITKRLLPDVVTEATVRKRISRARKANYDIRNRQNGGYYLPDAEKQAVRNSMRDSHARNTEGRPRGRTIAKSRA